MQEWLSRAYDTVAFGPLIGLSEAKFIYFPKRQCEIITEGQRLVIMDLARTIRNRQQAKSSDFIRKNILDGLPIIDSREQSRIPERGGLVVAMNHPQEGIAEGLSQIMSVTYTVEQAREIIKIGEGIHDDTSYARFLQAGRTEAKGIRFFREPANKGVAYTFGNYLADRGDEHKFPHSARRALSNLRKGGVVGICPEGKTNYELGPIFPKAKEFFDLLSSRGEFNYPVVPVGAWMEDNQYFVRIGRPLFPQECPNLGYRVMVEIAMLLPLYKRGIWR